MRSGDKNWHSLSASMSIRNSLAYGLGPKKCLGGRLWKEKLIHRYLECQLVSAATSYLKLSDVTSEAPSGFSDAQVL
jgi:hypothetical protein